MKTPDADLWTLTLWRHFLPSVAHGGPFYLAADIKLICDLYTAALHGNGGREAALPHFHESCQSLLRSTANRATVRPEAFRHVSGEPRSRVICLAVQQVLVVELMLHDGQYSENSYFPRYCRALQLPTRHTNPLGTEGFQKIWDVLRGELSAVGGATGKTITFSRGVGKDVSRNLPLSQALFTTHDLTIVREKAPSLDEKAHLRYTLRALRHVRSYLGARARKLIATADVNETLAARLHSQVQAFLADNAHSSRGDMGTPQDTQSGSIVAYLDRPDVFDADDGTDTFSVYLRADANQTSGIPLEAALRRRLSRKSPLVLISCGDAFWEASREENANSTDAVVVIVLAEGAEVFRAHASEHFRLSFIFGRSNLPDKLALLVCNDTQEGRLDMLLGRGAESGTKRGLHLEGGLMVDARSRVFLAGYPPTGVRHNGRVLSGEKVFVNRQARQVESFLDDLRQQRTAARYAIQYGSDSLEFTVATSISVSKSCAELGYLLNDDQLDPRVRPLVPERACLRGTLFLGSTVRMASRLSHRDLLLFTAVGKRLAVSEEIVALVLRELRLFGDANPRAMLAAAQMTVTKSIPLKVATSGLLQRLQANCVPPVMSELRQARTG